MLTHWRDCSLALSHWNVYTSLGKDEKYTCLYSSIQTAATRRVFHTIEEPLERVSLWGLSFRNTWPTREQGTNSRRPPHIHSFKRERKLSHYSYILMSAMACQITGILIVCSSVCSGADQRKHQSFASLAFVMGIHLWPVIPLTKGQ